MVGTLRLSVLSSQSQTPLQCQPRALAMQVCNAVNSIIDTMAAKGLRVEGL